MKPARGIPKATAFLLFAITALGILFGSGCVPVAYVESSEPAVTYDDYNEISDYDYLSDYGEWIRVPRYGMVWRPYVVAGWGPMRHGHWTWTNDGWAWISYEPFGWLVYHYGYWNYNHSYGWYWVPGNVWSPARVEWYTYGDYCGWAPMPPPHVYWPDPWDPWDTDIWVVVNIYNFTDDDIYRHHVAKRPPRDVVRREVVVRRPPPIKRVEEITKRTIPSVKIDRDRGDVRSEITKRPARPDPPREIRFKKMVLPERDMEKVKEYAPKVEREVLKKRETPPERERPATPENKSEEIRKREDTQKKEEPAKKEEPRKSEEPKERKVRRR